MIKPDGIQFFSQLPQYIELDPGIGSLAVSGVFPNGFSNTFTVTLSIDPASTRVDLYGTNSNTSKKQLLSATGFPAIYQNKAGELAQQLITYGPGTVKWDLTISNNTGSSVTLINQTITLEAVCYQLPI